jgi:hypothetical protein
MTPWPCFYQSIVQVQPFLEPQTFRLIYLALFIHR